MNNIDIEEFERNIEIASIRNIEEDFKNIESSNLDLMLKLKNLYEEVCSTSDRLYGISTGHKQQGIVKTHNRYLVLTIKYMDYGTLISEIKNMETILNSLSKYNILNETPGFRFSLRVNQEETFDNKGKKIWKYKGANVVINKPEGRELFRIKGYSGPNPVHQLIDDDRTLKNIKIRIPNNWKNIVLDEEILYNCRRNIQINNWLHCKPVVELYIKTIEQLNISADILSYNINNGNLILYVDGDKIDHM